MSEVFVQRCPIDAPAEAVFAWHERPGALVRLIPPWEHVEVVECRGGVRNGGRTVLFTRIGPARVRWVAEHRDYVAGRQFRDVQTTGPFARWEHTHLIEEQGPGRCVLEDRIEYALPLGGLGRVFAARSVRRKLDAMFAYRHRTTRDDVAAHQRHGDRGTMRILVSGARGLIGSALSAFLSCGGHRVVRLVREGPGVAGESVAWDPATGRLDASALEGIDAVVHLAGESIAERWTPEKKRRIRESRVNGTRLLAEALAGLPKPPKVFACASAIGWYGDRGDLTLTEAGTPGQGMLPDVCREWEAATQPAADAGIRVVNLRFGVVLSPTGGALAKMLTPFKWGAGGVVGSGRQYMSWIALDDAVGAIHHCLMVPELSGPVNVVAPRPVTNSDFTRTLGRVLGRPTFLPMPAFAARLAFGEMADALLLASARVEPARLQATDYPFRFPELEGALRHMLGRPG